LSAEIFSIGSDTGLTNLTPHAADDKNAVWSPDGELPAFETDRYGGGYEIAVMEETAGTRAG
jgi:Tol biopolymer transport system component